MTGPALLGEFTIRVAAALPEVEDFRTDPKLSLAVVTRGITAHVEGNVVWLAPSFAAGGTLASRVQHVEPTLYGMDEAALSAAVDAAVAHLG